ncbi:hypothetical protein [Fusobacterium sp.]|uniref:hypothetical protein n=1 Tax=Fusobacterium sp. TaxID=68766 RepID=UPI0028FF2DE9|nr:hypothetical protein [Fusobacterium sp.]MDU1911093.1 hypothetical protein [Fusobacterium sp.]
MSKKPVISNNKKPDPFADMGELLSQNTYQSTFDFGTFEIDEEDKKYIIQREEILYENFKTHSKSLYEICKALYEIKMKFKGDDTASFVAWYKHNKLSKDKVSELLKRYELFIQVPDKIEYVSSLSIPAVKALTKKEVDISVIDDILRLEIKNVDDINQKILEAFPVEETEDKKEKIKNTFSLKTIKFFQKKIKKSVSLSDLIEVKKDIQALKKHLQELEKEIELKEKEKENENNLTLPDGEQDEN